MKMVFSKDLKKFFSLPENTVLHNIDKDLSGLVVSGVCSEWPGDVIWILPENSTLFETRTILEQWLIFAGIEREIVVLPLPFGDPYVNNSIYPDYHIEKFSFFKAKLTGRRLVVITTLLGSSIEIEDPSSLKNMILTIKVKDTPGREDLISRLFRMGYSHSSFVDQPGELKKRGGVIDVFPSGDLHPVRIEFFGDSIESITVFDRNSRLSIRRTDHIEIPVYGLFGREMRFPELISGKKMKPLSAMLSTPKVVFKDKLQVEKSAEESIQNFRMIYDLCETPAVDEPEKLFRESSSSAPFLNIASGTDEISSYFELEKLKKNLRQFNTSDLEELRKMSSVSEVFFCSENRKLRDTLIDGGIKLKFTGTAIPHSFKNTRTSAVFITERNFIPDDRERIRSEDPENEKLLKTLVIDDFIVHEKHGIGMFRGFKVISIGGTEQEFIAIEYMNREMLFVPVTEANILNKYFSFKGAPAKLDRIGGKSWEIKKTRARKSIINFAKDLLDLYALRKSVEGFSHKGDPDFENRLVNSFPFIETPDQKRAIKEVLSDLERPFPMERLVCGDVSFGKTEVAIRAASRVVSGGKQVVVLCPTTILAMQHYRTFSERFEGLPVRVSLLSRMIASGERKQIFSELRKGNIDILIGTHSILSDKAEYRDLGLFIIDEEQRFGVFQKEKLKKGRENVDVLILSATPIPRTLSLSMAGLQDISTIKTPPLGRIRIRNYIGLFSKEVIVSAILRETARGGGVYIIYNSVEKIFAFKETLSGWLPDVRMAVIHARMNSGLIERNLLDFINGEYPVLLSTTIIENGIDITRVNTLIVVDSENFGLTQLYQLRGRIGRGELQAYAFFLTGGGVISEKARLRLEGIRDHSDVGAGFDLAEYDLKLRGAGSLLGNKQHGHIEALGFDYYNSMLKQSVDELKGRKTEKWKGELKVDFRFAIDEEYIPGSSERIGIYSRIIDAADFNELEMIESDIRNRFGPAGGDVSKIFYVARVKIIAGLMGALRAEVSADRFRFFFDKDVFAAEIEGNLKRSGIYSGSLTGSCLTFISDENQEILKEIYEKFKINTGVSENQ